MKSRTRPGDGSYIPYSYERAMEIVNRRSNLGHTFTEIANDLGISKQRVKQIYDRLWEAEQNT